MSLDEEQLKKAQAASERLAEAERAALLARAEYNTVVRRMHLAGASLREIAGALGLSHQRVQQIVDEAGGSWWRPRKRDAVCTFCERPPSEVKKLVSGPNVYICDGCVAHAEGALGALPPSRESALALARTGRAECSFCGKRRSSERLLVIGPTSNICQACVATCRQVITDSSDRHE
jgi:ClpX C4-type zinc finger